MKSPILLLAGFIFFAAVCRAAAVASPPNIPFIYTGDHSHRTVSCYPEAYPWGKTPHIDRLAKNGIPRNSATWR